MSDTKGDEKTKQLLTEILSQNLVTLQKLKKLEKSKKKEKLDSFIKIMKDHETALGSIADPRANER